MDVLKPNAVFVGECESMGLLGSVGSRNTQSIEYWDFSLIYLIDSCGEESNEVENHCDGMNIVDNIVT